MIATVLVFAAGMTMVPATPAALEEDSVDELVVSHGARKAILNDQEDVRCFEGQNEGSRDRDTRVCLTNAEWTKVEAGIANGLDKPATERYRGMWHGIYAQQNAGR